MESEIIKDDYIEKNRGYITASKLKCFIKSPEDFFLKYIKEITPPNYKEKKCFTLGNAIDDYISYGEKGFYERYWIDKGYTVAIMKEMLLKMGTDSDNMKKPQLADLIYGDVTGKIRLTKGESETVLGCVNELLRQDMFDKDGDYEYQKTYIGKYKSLNLKGTLDRDHKDMIRDTKSTKSIKSFKYDWSDNLGYDISMFFYWILKLKAVGLKSRLIFDVVQKSGQFPSRIFEIPQGEILKTIEHTIIPALDMLDEMMVKWEETKDENIWKIKWDMFDDLSECDMYSIMETSIQKEIEYLQ